MRAQAAVLHEPYGRWVVEEVEVAEPGPHEVLVRIVASGICQTDVHVRDGYSAIPHPVVLGHEGAGIIAAVGDGVTAVRVGDHVLLANPSCGDCPDCRDGFEAYCVRAPQLKQSGLRADGRSIAFRQGTEPATHPTRTA